MVAKMDVAKAWTHCSLAIQAVQDLVFPPVCLFCLDTPEDPQVHPSRFDFCRDCREQLCELEWDACPNCAALRISGRCVSCFQRSYAFDLAWALGPYEGALQEAVLRTKQRRFESLTLGLGRLLGQQLQSQLPSGVCVVPVPSHWSRRWSRGVQGSALLATEVADQLDGPMIPGLIAVRRTKKQGTLTVKRRFANVRGVFRAAKRYDFHGTSILLVDDVMTTGATASEAARVLKRAGASQVWMAVLARGTGRRVGPARHGAKRVDVPE